MAWFADGAPCGYFGEDLARTLRAVGWLERRRPFATGPVNPVFLDRLVELRNGFRSCTSLWYILHSFLGGHGCDLNPECQDQHGSKNLFIPGRGVVFAAPELVVHYIERHGYCPPDEFRDAVLRCPLIDSAAYLNALRANGGGALLGDGQ